MGKFPNGEHLNTFHFEAAVPWGNESIVAQNLVLENWNGIEQRLR